MRGELDDNLSFTSDTFHLFRISKMYRFSFFDRFHIQCRSNCIQSFLIKDLGRYERLLWPVGFPLLKNEIST